MTALLREIETLGPRTLLEIAESPAFSRSDLRFQYRDRRKKHSLLPCFIRLPRVTNNMQKELPEHRQDGGDFRMNPWLCLFN